MEIGDPKKLLFSGFRENNRLNKNLLWAMLFLLMGYESLQDKFDFNLVLIVISVALFSYGIKKSAERKITGWLYGFLFLNILFWSYFDSTMVNLFFFVVFGICLADSATVNRYTRVIKKAFEKEFPSLKSS